MERKIATKKQRTAFAEKVFELHDAAKKLGIDIITSYDCGAKLDSHFTGQKKCLVLIALKCSGDLAKILDESLCDESEADQCQK